MEALVTAAPPPPTPVPLHPAVAPSVELGFTVLYTILYAGLFLVVYVQLWLLYLYKHKRWSYQSVFLFLCVLWAALRTTLFSFYFYNALEANHLPVAVYWLLYCFPVCLQFFTFSLINMYFTQVRLERMKLGTFSCWHVCGKYGKKVTERWLCLAFTFTVEVSQFTILVVSLSHRSYSKLERATAQKGTKNCKFSSVVHVLKHLE